MNKDANALSRIQWAQEQVKSVLCGVTSAMWTAHTMEQQLRLGDDNSTATSTSEWQQLQMQDPDNPCNQLHQWRSTAMKVDISNKMSSQRKESLVH